MYESMIFYKSFYDAIQGLDTELQAEIYNAIFKYGLYGELDELSPIANTVFTLIKPQIDANNKRKENGKKGAEYGKLGGRPKKDNPKETPNKPQENSTQTPNVNENENDNVNANENEKKKTSPRKKTEPVKHKYGEWKNVLLSDDEYAKLKDKFPVDYEKWIDNLSGYMKSKGKTYKDHYATILNWSRRENEEKQDKPKGKSNQFNEFQQNQYDYDELERRLTANVKSG